MARLSLELIADANSMLAVLNRAQRQVDQFMSSTRAAGAQMGGGVNRALEAFEGLAKGGASAAGVLAGGLVAATAATVALTLSTGAQVEALEQLSQKTGITVQTIQRWSVLMAENSFQAESLTRGMRTLSKEIVEARNPASAAANTFEQMGISITALGSTDTAIKAISDAFKGMADGPDKAQLAITLFGKAGLDLIPLLNKGSAAFDESRRAAERFGTVLSGEQIAQLTRADDAYDRMGVALQGLKTQFALTFAGEVTTGITSITEGIAKLSATTANYSEALQRIRSNHPILSSLFPSLTAAAASFNASQMPIPVPPPPQGPQESHVAEFALEKGRQQEELGQRLLVQHLKVEKTLEGQRHAQEALGRVIVAIIQRETAERNNAFAMQLEQEEAINNLQFEKTSAGNQKAFDARLEEINALMRLIPELTFQEAALKAAQNREAGDAVINASRERLQILQETAERLAVQADTEQAFADQAAASYNQLGAVYSDVEFTGVQALDALDARMEASTAALDAQLSRQGISWDVYLEKVLQLDLAADAKRRQIVQEFPTFFESQMRTILQSNSFSTGQIISTWTNGVAGAIVKNQDFVKSAVESTQIALVQGMLNAGVQMAAQWALNASVELGILTATEATKLGLKASSEAAQTAVKVAGDAARVSSNATADAAMLASNTASATASTSIWGGAATAISGFFGLVSGGFAALSGGLVAAVTAVGEFIMGVLTSIAAAMKATIFGIPVGVALMVAVVGIAVALAATGNLGFKEGGIGDFGSGTQATLHGKEAIIPLNQRGASFLRDSLGGGQGSAPIHTHVHLNDREIALAVSNGTPSAWRTMGVL